MRGFDAFASETDENLPPWAGPSIYPRGPGRREIRPPRTGQPEPRARRGPSEARALDDDPAAPVGRPPYADRAPYADRPPYADRAPSNGADRVPSGDRSRHGERVPDRHRGRHGDPYSYRYPGDDGDVGRAAEDDGDHSADGRRHAGADAARGFRQRRAEVDEPFAPAEPAERDQPPRPGRSGSRGRAAAARARKSKRRLYGLAGLVVVIVIVVLAVTGNLPFLGSSPAPSNDGLITTFQPGEMRTVPNACHAVSATTLRQYLPGATARVAPSLSGPAESQCTWTLDAKPTYRVLEVTSDAYTPFPTAGNGSATANAIAAYTGSLAALRNPPRKTHLPKAQLGGAPGLGGQAFSAMQVIRSGGDTTYLVTVVIRDRNVLLTVVLQGLNHAKGYGPVSAATLRAGALAAAHEVLAGLH